MIILSNSSSDESTPTLSPVDAEESLVRSTIPIEDFTNLESTSMDVSGDLDTIPIESPGDFFLHDVTTTFFSAEQW
jgi:hypothetical protein